MLVGMLYQSLTVLHVSNPLHGMPVKRINVSLRDLWSQHPQFFLRELLIQFKRSRAVWLFLCGCTLTNVRLVESMIQFVLYSIHRSQLQQSFVELALVHAFVVHVDGNAILSLTVAAEISYLPNFSVSLRVEFS